ncbi:uncharacterized protein METZ01_LOCUS289065 [marine metagenome]|uniref:Sulfatase N-terminal domain-containing protein n=1 Tax=marine metagenome TaxID=408172 RepID=A0A382LMV4_9ZZZZ
MTGCVPSVHGVNWNGVVTPRRRRTLAEIAAAAGYATTAITNWGGFQQVYSDAGAGAEDNRGDRTITRVEMWLEAADGSQPQLLWVHFIDPHTPDNCPDPFPQTYTGEVRVRRCDGGQARRGLGREIQRTSLTDANHG